MVVSSLMGFLYVGQMLVVDRIGDTILCGVISQLKIKKNKKLVIVHVSH